MAEKRIKTAAQRRVEANNLHMDVKFRQMGDSIVATVEGVEFHGDRVAAQRLANRFKGKGWSVVVTNNATVIATVVVPR